MGGSYSKLKKIISCDTDVFDPVLHDMYTSQEVCIIENAGPRFNESEASDILKIPHEDAAMLLEAGYRRGVFNKCPDESPNTYEAAEMYARLDLFVLDDLARWKNYPEDFIKNADEWYFQEYGKRVEQRMLTEDSKPSEIVLPLEKAIEYIDGLPHDLYVLPCDCRSIKGSCGHMTDVCIQSCEASVNSIIDRGFGRRITREEAKDIIRLADKDGLIHSPTSYHFCNCCGDCCYPMRYSKIRKSRRDWPKSFYVAEISAENCIGCGLCAKRCPVDAIVINNKKAQINETECVGCGVCRVPCRKNAISMKEVVPYKNPVLV